MELQFETTAFPCLRQTVREAQSQEQTQELRLPDGMPDIGRVLGAWGQVLLRSKQWLTGGMSITGGVTIWVLYMPEDGSEARCVDSWLPFQMNWDFPETERDGVIQASCLLKSVDARSVSARKLMTRATVSLMGEAMEPVQLDITQPGEVPPDVQLLKNRYPLKIAREAGEKAFFLDEELTLPSSVPAMEKLLYFGLQPELIDQKVMSEKVVFRGAANLHAVYRAEDGQIANWNFEVPFSQYTELEREYDQNASACVIPAVTSVEMEQGENGTLRLKAGLVGQYVVYDQPVVELVEDAYSTTRAISVQTQQLGMPVVLDERRETLRAEQSVPAGGAQAADLAFFAEQPRCIRRDDGVEVEVPGGFQLLYWDENGALQGAAARWEGRLAIPADPDCHVEVSACLTGHPQAALNAGNAELHGEMLLQIRTVADRGMPMVTALELGEQTEPDPARPSLILRRRGEKRLWDLAKECGSTVSAIRTANGIAEEAEPDQLLLIPVS